MQSIAETINKGNELVDILSFFANKEWIFDSSTITRLNSNLSTPYDKKEFMVEVQTINWPFYAKNLGYGIKRYILDEEAALPSQGYADVV